MKNCFVIVVLVCINPVFGQDTLNRIDAQGKKYGWWQIYGGDKMYAGKGYAENAVAEEGKFVDGKKNGIWKTYYPSGKIKSEVECKNGRPSGKFITYYENGCAEEEGTWKNNSYIGDFYKYSGDSCGKIIQHKIFNDNGKIEERRISCGPYHDAKTELIFNSNDTLKTKQNQLQQSSCTPKNANGQQTVYDDLKRLCMDGEFKSGKLYNGKWYIYDKNGLIIQVKIYKNGKYVGDGELE